MVATRAALAVVMAVTLTVPVSVVPGSVLAEGSAVAEAEVPAYLGVWVPQAVVGSEPAEASSLRMNLDPGSGVAAWLGSGGDLRQVRAAVRLRANEWAPPDTVSDPGVPTDSPSLDALSSGVLPAHTDLAMLAWRAYDGVSWRIQASVYRPGKQWSDPVTLSPPGADAADPVAKIIEWGNGDLEPRVLWRQQSGAVWRVQLAALDAKGKQTRPVRSVSTPGRDTRDLRMGDDVDALWTEFDGADWRLRVGEVAFLQQKGSRYDVSPPGEDVHEPAMSSTPSTSAYAWLRSDGTTQQVRALLSSRSGNSPVEVSPAGLPAEAVSVRRGTITDQDEFYVEYDIFFWRQFDGTNWRVASRVKVDGEPFGEVAYLSNPGVDASAPVSDAAGVYPEGTAITVGWTEPTSLGSVTRVARYLPVPDLIPVPTISTLSGAAVAAGAVAVAQGGRLGPGVAWVSGTSPARISAVGLDLVAASGVVHPLPRLLPDGPRAISWLGSDDWSPVISYDVRRTVHRWDRKKRTTDLLLSDTGRTTTSTRLRGGRSYCYSVSARDALGRAGAFSTPPVCTTTPVHDRALKRHGPWRSHQTYLESRTQGASLALRRLPVRRSFVVRFRVGPGHGRTVITAGAHSWSVNLDRRRSGTAKVYVHGTRGPLTFTVASRDKPVRVEGVYAEPAQVVPCTC